MNRWLDTLIRYSCQTSGADVLAGNDKTRSDAGRKGLSVGGQR